MAFRFTREQILPLFLEQRITTAELARRAGVNPKTAERAVNGYPVSADIVDKISAALKLGDTLKFLTTPTATP